MILKFLNILLGSILFFSCGKLYAQDCHTKQGLYSYSYSYVLTGIDNYIGATFGWADQSTTGSYTWIDCDGNEDILYSARPAPGLTAAGTDSDGTQWFDIAGNDYLQIAVKIFVYNLRGGGTYHNVPFTSVNNNCGGRCGNGGIATGSQVSLKARLKKQVIGQVHFSLPVAYLYAAQDSESSLIDPIASISVTGIADFKQACSFDVGDVVEFDFGIIPSSAFSKAGIGNIPVGVNKLQKNLQLQCNNIESYIPLTMSIEANNFEKDYMKSSNNDIGFKISDGNDYLFIPNDNSSNVSFQLDSNSTANIILKAWPISTTGQKPDAGQVTGEGYLRIDYQ